MKKLIYTLCAVCSLTLLSSCIENDLSVPTVVSDFVTFEVEGQEEVTIDAQTRTVTIILDEVTDIANVKLIGYSVSNGGTLLNPLPEYLDLSSPIEVILHTYRDFKWTISAVQPIDRYIRCDNQVGEAEIDPVRKTAYVYVTEDQSLMSVRVNEMKLEPEGSVVAYTTGFVSENGHSVPKTEACDFPMLLDCVVMRYFTVQYDSEDIEWSVKFLQKAVEVSMLSVNAWTYSVEVAGITNGRGVPAFEYCLASEKEDTQAWMSCTDVDIVGTNVTAVISELSEDTDYLVRLTNGTDVSSEFAFRTGKALQLDNMDFDLWHQSNPNASWYPFAEDAEGVWGTANPGTNFANTVNPTRPEYDHVVTPGGAAVRMESLKALGVFAAGNIFTGEFIKFSFAEMAAQLHWGTPFNSRPYSLKGYYDYAPAIVGNAPGDVAGAPNPYVGLKGANDYMQILAVLVDEAENEADKGPFLVLSTKPGFPDLQKDPRIIGFGTIESNESTGGQYKEFECVIDYYDDRTPDYVIVVACSSLRGNFFTGGLGSVLYVDDFSFIYK